jgi:hypothetical protein
VQEEPFIQVQGDEGALREREGHYLGKLLGMRAHVVIAWPRIMGRASICGANVHDLYLAERLLEGMGRGSVLADRNYWVSSHDSRKIVR